MKRAEYLQKLMTDNGLDPDKVAQILSYYGHQTTVYYVNAWLTDSNVKKVSLAQLRVLELSCYVYQTAGQWPDPCARALV